MEEELGIRLQMAIVATIHVVARMIVIALQCYRRRGDNLWHGRSKEGTNEVFVMLVS
jgi:hypothetical protein